MIFIIKYIKKKYGSKAKLLFTDTKYEIQTEDRVYKNFFEDKDKFDFSDSDQTDSPYFNKTNKTVIGKFKDEAGGACAYC